MLTYVYIGSVGPFGNVYINKKKCEFFNAKNDLYIGQHDLKPAFFLRIDVNF